MEDKELKEFEKLADKNVRQPLRGKELKRFRSLIVVWDEHEKEMDRQRWVRQNKNNI